MVYIEGVGIRSRVGRVFARRWLAAAAVAAVPTAGCNRSEQAAQQGGAPASAPATPSPTGGGAGTPDRAGDSWAQARDAMVREQIEARGVREPSVLAALRKVPRHELVPAAVREQAYDDHPLPIGHDQTISQPFIVGLMTELAQVEPRERVLEVGTGSGYQAAVLAALGADVYSIEIVAPLARRAAADLERLGYRVHVRAGDGYRGWPEAAPFDAILVTAAPPHVPQPLVEQLARGGRMVIPVGDNYQELRVLSKDESGAVRTDTMIPVRFVPMTGEAQELR